MTGTATVKMTYVDYDNADTSFGEIAVGATARAGYNKISGEAVGFGNTGWGENKIAYLQVDASAIEGTITGASLSLDVSGSSDNKRQTTWGVGYNASDWAADMTYNTADKSITTLGSTQSTSTKSATVFETKTFDIIDALKDDADKVVTILVYETAAAGGYVKNPAVTITYTNAATANYTVKYICGDVEVKDAVTRVGIVGETVTLEDGDQQAVNKDDVKYIYTGSNAAETTISEDGTTVVTVTFREAAKYSWTATSNVGGYSTSGEVWEGDNASAVYPKFLLVDGKLWKKDANSNNFHQSFAVTEDNFQYTLTYTETENEAIFLAEAEDIEGATASTVGNADIRCSMGTGAYFSADTKVTTLSAGKYSIFGQVWGGSGTTFTIKAGNREIWSLGTTGSITYTSSEFVITKETDIVIPAVGNANRVLDLIYIQSLGEPTDEELAAAAEAEYDATHEKVTVTDAGYATYCSSYALDFSGVTGLTAYTASLEGSTVKFSEVSGSVPAGTGLLLKGKAGEVTTADAEIVESSETDVTGNILVGAITSKNIDAGSFVLMNGAQGVGFYKTTKEFTVGANTAYIAALPNSSEDSRSFIGFSFDDNSVTGLTAINGVQANGVAYTLHGQRVSAPQQGLYIVNGKKVIIK